MQVCYLVWGSHNTDYNDYLAVHFGVHLFNALDLVFGNLSQAFWFIRELYTFFLSHGLRPEHLTTHLLDA